MLGERLAGCQVLDPLGGVGQLLVGEQLEGLLLGLLDTVLVQIIPILGSLIPRLRGGGGLEPFDKVDAGAVN